MEIIVGNTYVEMFKRRYFVMIILPFLWTFGVIMTGYLTDNNSIVFLLLLFLTAGIFWLDILFILITLLQGRFLVAMFLSTVNIMVIIAVKMYFFLNMPQLVNEADFYIHQDYYEQQVKIRPSTARDNGKKLVEFPLRNNQDSGVMVTIVYDESDELAMPYHYRTLDESWDKNNTVVGRQHLDINRIKGHFYLVDYYIYSYIANEKATQTNIKGNTDGTNSY